MECVNNTDLKLSSFELSNYLLERHHYYQLYLQNLNFDFKTFSIYQCTGTHVRLYNNNKLTEYLGVHLLKWIAWEFHWAIFSQESLDVLLKFLLSWFSLLCRHLSRKKCKRQLQNLYFVMNYVDKYLKKNQELLDLINKKLYFARNCLQHHINVDINVSKLQLN